MAKMSGKKIKFISVTVKKIYFLFKLKLYKKYLSIHFSFLNKQKYLI